MGRDRDQFAGYCSRVVGGLVACALVATTLRVEVAAVTILAAVMLAVLVTSWLMLRERDL